MFDHHNTDLDEYEDQFQFDKLASLHKQLGFKEENKKDNDSTKGAVIPK